MAEKPVALVTGAGSGIGKASALVLAGDGYVVGVLGHTEEENRQTAEAIRASGGQAEELLADVTHEDEMKRAVAKMVDTYGRLDVVVANAGINGKWAPIDELTPADWDKTIAVNLKGTYLTIHTVTPHMKSAKKGSIIVIASINGTRTFTSPGATAYVATKAAEVAMVKQLALELGKHGIRINAVCPGKIETKIDDNTEVINPQETAIPVEWPEGEIPLTGDKPGKAEDVANTVAFLASSKAAHITGSPIWVDGGQSLLR
ncbi:SDR family NAD(P)-dependent oxidoreductase [Rhizobium sp. L1K21]|uniref:SDR family oxidoreductase n=1 Tax=Rhizobium sp. L1K21 TaxID=2954933 RepID=UPI0020922C83|nr:SDR family NAD(P)-dependent oxidoreductase [Rhizobium sp. L1K21]MCO6187819.1 SDR family oxidoreductase [Rhizobium sp. L1K21]